MALKFEDLDWGDEPKKKTTEPAITETPVVSDKPTGTKAVLKFEDLDWGDSPTATKATADEVDEAFARVAATSKDQATIGNVLGEGTKNLGRAIARTGEGTLGQYQQQRIAVSTPMEEGEKAGRSWGALWDTMKRVGKNLIDNPLPSMDVTADVPVSDAVGPPDPRETVLQEEGPPVPGQQFMKGIAESDFLKQNEEVMRDMTYWDQVAFMIPQVTLQGALAIITRGKAGAKWVGMGNMGAQIMGNKIDNLTQQGMDLRTATKAGFLDAVWQAPMEQFGINTSTASWKIKVAIGKRLKTMALAYGSEFGTEAAQVLPDTITELMAKDPDMNVLEAIWETLSDIKTYKAMGIEGSIGGIFGFSINAAGQIKSKVLAEAAKESTESDVVEETPVPDETVQPPPVESQRLKDFNAKQAEIAKGYMTPADADVAQTDPMFGLPSQAGASGAEMDAERQALRDKGLTEEQINGMSQADILATLEVTRTDEAIADEAMGEEVSQFQQAEQDEEVVAPDPDVPVMEASQGQRTAPTRGKDYGVTEEVAPVVEEETPVATQADIDKRKEFPATMRNTPKSGPTAVEDQTNRQKEKEVEKLLPLKGDPVADARLHAHAEEAARLIKEKEQKEAFEEEIEDLTPEQESRAAKLDKSVVAQAQKLANRSGLPVGDLTGAGRVAVMEHVRKPFEGTAKDADKRFNPGFAMQNYAKELMSGGQTPGGGRSARGAVDTGRISSVASVGTAEEAEGIPKALEPKTTDEIIIEVLRKKKAGKKLTSQENIIAMQVTPSDQRQLEPEVAKAERTDQLQQAKEQTDLTDREIGQRIADHMSRREDISAFEQAKRMKELGRAEKLVGEIQAVSQELEKATSSKQRKKLISQEQSLRDEVTEIKNSMSGLVPSGLIDQALAPRVGKGDMFIEKVKEHEPSKKVDKPKPGKSSKSKKEVMKKRRDAAKAEKQDKATRKKGRKAAPVEKVVGPKPSEKKRDDVKKREAYAIQQQREREQQEVPDKFADKGEARKFGEINKGKKKVIKELKVERKFWLNENTKALKDKDWEMADISSAQSDMFGEAIGKAEGTIDKALVAHRKTRAQGKKVKKETILPGNAAIKVGNKVHVGPSHLSIIMENEGVAQAIEADKVEVTKGFRTTEGNFVTRGEGALLMGKDTPLRSEMLPREGDEKKAKSVAKIEKEGGAAPETVATITETLKNEKGEIPLPGWGEDLNNWFKRLAKYTSVTTYWSGKKMPNFGEAIRRIFSIRTLHDKNAENLGRTVEKDIKVAWDKLKGKKFYLYKTKKLIDLKTIDDLRAWVSFVASDEALMKKLPVEVAEAINAPVNNMRTYFEMANRQNTKDGLLDLHFLRNEQNRLEEKMKFTHEQVIRFGKKPNKLRAVKKAAANRRLFMKYKRKLQRVMGDISYIAIPSDLLSMSEHDMTADQKKRAKRLRFAIAKRRTSLSVKDAYDMNILTKEDVAPSTILIAYGRNYGQARSMVGIRDSLIKDGQAVAQKDKPVTKDALESRRVLIQDQLTTGVDTDKMYTKLKEELKEVTKQLRGADTRVWVKAADNSTELEKSVMTYFDEKGVKRSMWITMDVKDTIEALQGPVPNSNIAARIMQRIKMATFFKLWYMPVNDMLQNLVFASGLLHPYAHLKGLAQGAHSLWNKTDDYNYMSDHAGFSTPHGNNVQTLRDLDRKIKNGTASKSPIYTFFHERLKDAISLHSFDKSDIKTYHKPLFQAYDSIMSMIWDTSWLGDQLIRMSTYHGLLNRGYSKEYAVRHVARSLADYADVPAVATRKSNKIVYTPTYTISMIKQFVSTLASPVRILGEVLTPGATVSERNKLEIQALISIMVGLGSIDYLMTAILGWDRDEFGRKYTRPEDTFAGIKAKTINVTMPFNKPIKYYYILQDSLGQEAIPGINTFMQRMSWDLTPAIRIAMNATQGKDARGEEIFSRFDDGPVKARKAIVSLVGDILPILKVGSDKNQKLRGVSVNESKRIRNDMGNIFKMVEHLGFVHLGMKTGPELSAKYRTSAITREFRNGLVKAALEEREVDIEMRVRNYIEQMEKAIEEIE